VQVFGVIDLLDGRAVHAVAGARDRYQPVESLAERSIAAGDAETLARYYIGRLGVDALYVADLDAIQGRGFQHTLVASLCQLGVPVYVDAGVSTVDAARRLLAAGPVRVIVGLETLRSFDALDDICAEVGGSGVVFSLDLQNGRTLSSGSMQNVRPETMIRRAVGAGVQSVIVLDLARVGTGAGLDFELIARARKAAGPQVTLLAGGGVRGWNDLEALAATGCDGALVATALQNGRLSAHDVLRARELFTFRQQ